MFLSNSKSGSTKVLTSNTQVDSFQTHAYVFQKVARRAVEILQTVDPSILPHLQDPQNSVARSALQKLQTHAFSSFYHPQGHTTVANSQLFKIVPPAAPYKTVIGEL